MRREIATAQDLAAAVRAARKAQGIRQDELAAMVPASHVFIIGVERGKPTAHIGKVFAILRELGIRLWLDIPEVARKHLETHQPKRAGRPRRRG